MFDIYGLISEIPTEKTGIRRKHVRATDMSVDDSYNENDRWDEFRDPEESISIAELEAIPLLELPEDARG